MTKEIKVALLAIVSILFLYFGYFFLKGRNVFSSEQYFKSVFKEIDLLSPGDQVILNGIQVGQIYTTTLDPDGGLITVEFTVRPDLKLPKGTVATIYSADLLGDKAMKLVYPVDGKASGFYEDGATIDGNLDKGMTDMLTKELLPVKDQISQMLGSVDTLMGKVNVLLDNGRLDSTLKSVNILTNNLALATNGIDKTIRSLTVQFDDLMGDFKELSSTFTNNKDEIDNLIGNTSKITEDFSELSGKMKQLDIESSLASFEATLNDANKTVTMANQLLSGLNEGEGTAGAILNDRTIYDNLDKVSADLDSLLVDFKANPKRYVHFSLIDRTAKIEAKQKRREERKAKKAAK